MKGVEKKVYKEMSISNTIIKEGSRKKDIKEKNIIYNINKMTDNKNLNNSIMNIPFTTFKLRYNSKFPSDEWSKDEEKKYHINTHLWKDLTMNELQERGENRGIPCGKINGIFVLDLDLYVKEEKNPYDPDNCLFRKTFGSPEEYIKKHKKEKLNANCLRGAA